MRVPTTRRRSAHPVDCPIDMDTFHQEVAFGLLEGIDPIDRFGLYANSEIVMSLPTTTPLRSTSSLTGDYVSRMGCFPSHVSDMKQMVMPSATSPAGVKGTGKPAFRNTAGCTSPSLSLRNTTFL